VAARGGRSWKSRIRLKRIELVESRGVASAIINVISLQSLLGWRGHQKSQLVKNGVQVEGLEKVVGREKGVASACWGGFLPKYESLLGWV